MRHLRVAIARLAGLFAEHRADADSYEELRSHVELATAENIRRGMNADEARRAAVLASGGLTMATEAVREQRRLPWIDSIAADVRYALRALRRNPAFTAVAVTTLALGIGANTAIFSIVNAVVLRPLPYPEPERLVSVTSLVNGSSAAVSPPDYMDWLRDARSFTGLAASYSSETILTGSGDAERLAQARVTSNAFDVLAVRPVLGRAFLPGEDRVSAPRVAMLSEGLWRRQFAADPAIVGRSLLLDGFPTTVVGIAPAAMQWPDPVDVWLAARFSERDLEASSRGARFITVVGRLSPNASVATARAEMDAMARRLAQLDPVHNTNVGSRVTPLLTDLVGDVQKPLYVLLGAVGFVLLIACANVGALTLGRVAARDAELAVRTALGASRGRIARQVLTESLVLAMLGGVLGLLLAVAAARALVAIAPANLPRLDDVALDVRVLTFSFAVTSLTGLLFGVGPAIHGSGVQLHDRLRSAGRGAPGHRSAARSRHALAMAEVTLAVVLLAGAGLLLRSLERLRDVDPGFRAEGVSTFSTGQLPRRYSTKEREIEFTRRLLEGIRRLPGVTAADVSFNLPLSGGGPQLTFAVRGDTPPDPRNEPRAQARAAGPDYFAAMGIPLIRGRLFDETDRGGPGVRQVLIISAEVARRYFAGSDPIGKYIETGWGGPGWPGTKFGGEVIGIVGDVRQGALAQGMTPHMYMPYQQWPINEYDVVIRSTASATSALNGARAVLRQLDRDIPMNDAGPMTDVVNASLGDRRFYLTLLAIFAGVALSLALVGIYGVMAYGVQQRRREIGIRLALGASRERVLATILSEGLRIVVAGAACGVLASLLLTRLIQAMLYEVGSRDPITFLVVPALLILVATVACALPARRAALVNPVETIRAD